MENLFNAYFASANGFEGFRSNFRTVFNPKEYERICVLKGGPGTGKSTLMKNVRAHFKELGFRVESVHCSSDRASLDGIIIIGGEKRAAIIDGTAPHETDARIPGAIDKIINLGDFWREDELAFSRDEILTLNREKAAHYEAAYELLALAGSFYFKRADILHRVYNSCSIGEDVFSKYGIKNKGRIREYKTLSCFGKDGYQRLSVPNLKPKRSFLIGGIYGSESLFLTEILEKARAAGISYCALISPLSERIIEGIFFPEEEILFDTKSGSELIDTSLFLDKERLARYSERPELYTDIIEKLMENSVREFQRASDVHFRLEEIYKRHMNFDAISTLTQNICRELEGKLFH
ncbi:MAG: hypothetical protein J6V09_02305 [Clostridia bacterium]|nr:hypothetical protein [Clostridia bacterium]